MAQFEIADGLTRKNEGGHANNPGDTGKETYCGISRRWHPKWNGWPDVDAAKPLKPNEHIESAALDEKVRQFYRSQFWNVIKGDQIRNQEMANQIYDNAVNCSTVVAIEKIQGVLRIPQTGIMDTKTIQHINVYNR